MGGIENHPDIDSIIESKYQQETICIKCGMETNKGKYDYPCEQTTKGNHQTIPKPVHEATKFGYCQYPYGEHEDDEHEHKEVLELMYHLIDGTDYLDYRYPYYFCEKCIKTYNLGDY